MKDFEALMDGKETGGKKQMRRLIDADKVLNDMMRLKHDKEYSDVDEAYDYGIDECIGEVSGADLIDAEPVEHAHWIDTPSCWKCSICGETYWSMNHEFIYCPHCGAKMDEEV